MGNSIRAPQAAIDTSRTWGKEEDTFLPELSRLLTASDDEFAQSLFGLIATIESDFREEEDLMEHIDFQDSRRHREQHAKMLGTLHSAVPKVMQGDYALARIMVELLPQWFLVHLLKMDAALIAALDSAGLQRRLPAAAAPQAHLAGSQTALDLERMFSAP